MRTSWFFGALLTASVLVGCSDDNPQAAAKLSGSALASSAPKTADAKEYTVDAKGSTLGFMMEAPDEKIRGKAPESASGTVYIDIKDLSQTTGNIVVDIGKLELYQRVKDDSGNFKDEVKHDKQNEHAMAWLEIDAAAPEADRTKNRRVEFRIDSVDGLSEKDLTKLTGNERTVTFKANGQFLLHGIPVKKTAELQATFTFEGETAKAVTIKTTKSVPVGLAEHDVRPREAFGKLAQKTLDSLGSKVAKDAMVDFEIKMSLK